MTRRLARIVVAAALAGVAGGAVAAVAVPDEGGAASPPAPRVEPQRTATLPGTRRLRLVSGTMRVELRRDDPDGGAPWRIRSFVAAVPGHSTRLHCSQLGRTVRGRFGWIDGSNVFRPAGVDTHGQAPTVCGGSAPGADQPPRFDVRSLVTGIDGPHARLATTVAWGVVGARATGVKLRLGGEREPPLSGRGAFLEFAAKAPRRGEVTATYSYGGGKTLRAPAPPATGRLAPPRGVRASPGGTPGPGPVRLLARAPDPAGGLAWGIGGVSSDAGGSCLGQPQRVVGGRVGDVDFDLGTFTERYVIPSECRRPDDPGLKAHPVALAFQIGDGVQVENGGDAERRARIERRTLPGTTIVWGTARRDVRALTIATPRDVRTLVPSSDAHAFIAVYDGGFPTGKIVTTAHFADGSSRVVDSFDIGGI